MPPLFVIFLEVELPDTRNDATADKTFPVRSPKVERFPTVMGRNPHETMSVDSMGPIRSQTISFDSCLLSEMEVSGLSVLYQQLIATKESVGGHITGLHLHRFT